MNGNLRTIENNDWIFILLMIICGVLVLTRWAFKRYYSGLFDLKKYSEKKDNFLFFNGLYVLVFSVLLGLIVLPYFNKSVFFLADYSKYSKMLIISGFFFLFIILKIIVNGLIFFSMNKSELLKPLLICKSYYGVWATFGVILFTFLFVFSRYNVYGLSIFMIVFIGLMLLASLYSFYKKVHKEYNFSIYYIILYLCTLEILPFMIVGKLMLS